MQTENPKYRICIIAPEKDAYSETFIRAHIENMPGEVFSLYGMEFPTYKDNGEPLLSSPHLWRRGFRFLLKKLFKISSSPDVLRTKAFKKFLIDYKIEAVLAEYGPTGYAIRKVCEEAKVPLIVHFHGYDAYEDQTLIKYNRYKDMFQSAAAIIAVSQHMKKQLMELGAPMEKIKYIPCGVDLKQFHGSDPQQASPVFVSAGRFVDKKAPHLTLLAFKKVLDKVPEARLKMFGNGDLFEACQQLVKALKMSHAVSFKGVQTPKEIASEMRHARGFVQHSLQTTNGNSEGTPVAILEACASGLPVASTRHGGIVDVVVDGETGLLCNEGDIDGMADAILKLAQHPSLAGEMGQKAQQRIKERFTLERSMKALYDVIRHMINAAKHPPPQRIPSPLIEEKVLMSETVISLMK